MRAGGPRYGEGARTTTGRKTREKRGVGERVAVGLGVGPVTVGLADAGVGNRGIGVTVSVGDDSGVANTITVGVAAPGAASRACLRKLTPTRVAQKATRTSRVSASNKMQPVRVAELHERPRAPDEGGAASPLPLGNRGSSSVASAPAYGSTGFLRSCVRKGRFAAGRSQNWAIGNDLPTGQVRLRPAKEHPGGVYAGEPTSSRAGWPTGQGGTSGEVAR
jgi:hypothetical protein